MRRIDFKRRTTNGSADACQDIITSDSAQIGALSSHIRSGDDEEIWTLRNLCIVHYTLFPRHERMSHILGTEYERLVGNDRVGVLFVVESESAQSAKSRCRTYSIALISKAIFMYDV